MQASFLRLSATRLDPEAVLDGRGQPEDLECDGNGLGPPAPQLVAQAVMRRAGAPLAS